MNCSSARHQRFMFCLVSLLTFGAVACTYDSENADSGLDTNSATDIGSDNDDAGPETDEDTGDASTEIDTCSDLGSDTTSEGDTTGDTATEIDSGSDTDSITDPQLWMVNAAAVTSGDGHTWATAFKELQEALAFCAPGDILWVAAGTYKPTSGTDAAISFVMKKNIALYGGFNGTETAFEQRDWKVNQTILSGDIGIETDSSDNTYRVVIGADNATLDGFTVKGSRGEVPDSDVGISGGCGMSIYQCSVFVSNCAFSGNDGHGMAMEEGNQSTIRNCVFDDNNYSGLISRDSKPLISNCVFTHNSTGLSTSSSGNYSFASPVISDSVFSRNYSYGMYNYGSSPTVTGSTFSENDDGGMKSDDGATPTVINCNFSANKGDGIILDDSYGGTQIVSESIFSQNTGAGIRVLLGSNVQVFGSVFSKNLDSGMNCELSTSAEVTNSLFVGNSAVGNGGGMMVVSDIVPLFIVKSCTFIGNAAGGNGGGLYNGGDVGLLPIHNAVIANSIFRNNSAASGNAIFSFSPNATQVTYSNVEGSYPGEGNIDADPLFVDAADPDGLDDLWITADDGLTLSTSPVVSPSINSGSNAANPVTISTDIAGNPRLFGGTIDMGAYENQNQ